MMTRIYPVRGNIYSYAEITNLYLRDSEHLMFDHQETGQRCVVQTSHVTEEELLSIPRFAETKWRYMRETDEWVPLFQFVEHAGEPNIETFLDIEQDGDDEGFWCVPKAFPRKQWRQLQDE